MIGNMHLTAGIITALTLIGVGGVAYCCCVLASLTERRMEIDPPFEVVRDHNADANRGW